MSATSVYICTHRIFTLFLPCCQVWAVKSYTKSVPLYIQVLQRNSLQLIAPFLDPEHDVIVSMEQTRHRLLALSCLCPGASTLIGDQAFQTPCSSALPCLLSAMHCQFCPSCLCHGTPPCVYPIVLCWQMPSLCSRTFCCWQKLFALDFFGSSLRCFTSRCTQRHAKQLVGCSTMTHCCNGSCSAHCKLMPLKHAQAPHTCLSLSTQQAFEVHCDEWYAANLLCTANVVKLVRTVVITIVQPICCVPPMLSSLWRNCVEHEHCAADLFCTVNIVRLMEKFVMNAVQPVCCASQTLSSL